MLKAATLTASIVAVLAGLIVLALTWKPRPFPLYPAQSPAMRTVPLPDGLPAPVARFYRTIMGDRMPVIETAVLTGRGHIRLMGVRFPTRLRFTYMAGQGYRHYIEVTLFGKPLFRVNERYLDGQALMELPTGVVENDPKTNMAANAGLWAEAISLPSVYLADPRVRWEAVDETTARLIVPFGDDQETFTVRFDPETGLVRYLDTLRWKKTDSPSKLGWRCEILKWERRGNTLLPATSAATWEDEKGPWLVYDTEELVYNVDVSDYITAKGP